MKNFQQNLLIFLAVCLCGLCAYQWYFETTQRARLEQSNQVIFEKATRIQEYTNSIQLMDRQIAQMDQQIMRLTAAARTNEQMLVSEKREVARLNSANDILTNEVVQYKSAVDGLEAKLKEAYDGIARQNKAFQELVTERNQFVQKYNDSVKERNDLVAKYNQLVERLEKLQSANAKAP
jgi:chromosome segregation ATPase